MPIVGCAPEPHLTALAALFVGGSPGGASMDTLTDFYGVVSNEAR